MTRALVHATALDIAGRGVALLGPSGAGKSDLALRLIGEGALLVADDRAWVSVCDGRLVVTMPETIAGQIEGRGVGILRAARVASTRLALAVWLSTQTVERMPEPAQWAPPEIPDAPSVALLQMNPFEASATAKLRLALAVVPVA